MTASPTFSVVTVTYNSADALAPTLATLRTHLPGIETIVVDNGSTDGTVAIAREAADVRVVSGHGNIGFGAAANLGIDAATTTHVLVLNPDAPIARADLAALTAVATERPFGLRPAHELMRGEPVPLLLPQYAWVPELLWTLTTWFVVPAEMPSLRKPRLPGTRPYASGAAVVVQVEEFRQIGSFDERLFLYHEDEDLSSRYRHAGLPIRAVEAIVVAHDQGHSSPRDLERVMAWKLLSAIQLAHTSGGARRGRRVARWTLRGLTAIAGLGGVARRLPVLGPRAEKKAASARRVRELIHREAAEPPTQRAYPDTRTALPPAQAHR